MPGQRLYATSVTPGRVVYGPFSDVGYIMKRAEANEKTEEIQQARYHRRQVDCDERKNRKAVERQQFVNWRGGLLDMAKVRSSVNRLVELGLKQGEDELAWRRNKLRKQLLEEQERQNQEYITKAQTWLDVRLAEEKQRAEEIISRKTDLDEGIAKAILERQILLNSEEFKNKLLEENSKNLLESLKAQMKEQEMAKLEQAEYDETWILKRDQDVEMAKKDRECEEAAKKKKMRQYCDALQEQVEAKRVLSENMNCVERIEQREIDNVKVEIDKWYELREDEKKKNEEEYNRSLMEQIKTNRAIAVKEKEQDLFMERLILEDDERKKREEAAKIQDNRRKAWSELVIFKEAINQYREDVLRQQAIAEEMADKMRAENDARQARERIERNRRRRQLDRDVAEAALAKSAEKAIENQRKRAVELQWNELRKHRAQMQDRLDAAAANRPFLEVSTNQYYDNQIKYMKVLEERQNQEDRDMLAKMKKADDDIHQWLKARAGKDSLGSKSETLFHSRAIATYLANSKSGGDKIYPRDPKKRAMVDQMLYFDMGKLYQRFYDLYPPMLLMGQPNDSGKMEKLDEAVKMFEEYLTRNKWAAGNQMTVADISLLASVSTLEAVGYDFSKYPKILAWYENSKKMIPDYETVNQEGANVWKTISENHKKGE